MKMFLGDTPVKSLNIKHFEMDTNDCTMVPSDLQSGVTAVARGQKITGTGKAFEFASYGGCITNLPIVVPSVINAIQISSVSYPVRMVVPVYNTTRLDFSVPQTVAEITVGGEAYPMIVSVQNGILIISCSHTIDIELFYGKDRYA